MNNKRLFILSPGSIRVHPRCFHNQTQFDLQFYETRSENVHNSPNFLPNNG